MLQWSNRFVLVIVHNWNKQRLLSQILNATWFKLQFKNMAVNNRKVYYFILMVYADHLTFKDQTGKRYLGPTLTHRFPWITIVSHLHLCLWPGVCGKPLSCCGPCCPCVCSRDCQTCGAFCREGWHPRSRRASSRAGGPLLGGSWTSIWEPAETRAQVKHQESV